MANIVGPRPLVLTVTPIGLSDLGAAFQIDKPYTGCRLCGRLFQTNGDRIDNPTPRQVLDALVIRRDWSFKHARTHPQWEHDQLERSGAYMTPEAAYALASFGVISLTDMALIDEHWHAGRESHRVPHNDVEGGN